MSADKNLDELVDEFRETIKSFAVEADDTLKREKKKAKRQRQRMRKRGIRLVQDYCN